MKIFHANNEGPRASRNFTQGMLELGWDVSLFVDYEFLGQKIKASTNFEKDILEADFVLLSNKIAEKYIDQKNLWYKTISYDYGDLSFLNDIQQNRFNKSLNYFRRSIYDSDRNKTIETNNLDYCALNEYFQGTGKNDKWDVSCFFNKEYQFLGKRRRLMLNTLSEAGFHNSLIGHTTGFGGDARNAIRFSPPNPFTKYIQLLSESKIVFTAYPEKYDGDCRTWEAMASGALVFKDTTKIKTEYPLVNGKHCFIFDATSKKDIERCIDLARYYLEHEEERKSIAQNGLEYTRKHHRSINLVRYVFKSIISI